MSNQSAQVAVLRNRITDEVVEALGLSPLGWARRLLAPVIWPPANRFANLAAGFDHQVALGGFCEAARWVLPRFVVGTEQLGAERIPREGPLLITSNHPGAYDTLVISANIFRTDLKIIASGIPFFRELPATGRHLIYLTRRDTQQRMTVVRKSIRHLQNGGALLIFPGGQVAPDPAILPGAHEAIGDWSPSLEIFLRRVPQTQVLVSIVSGVLSPAWLRHPLVRLRRGQRERQLLAEFLQVIQLMLFGRRSSIRPQVSFGVPTTAAALRARYDSADIMPSIIKHAQQLLAACTTPITHQTHSS